MLSRSPATQPDARRPRPRCGPRRLSASDPNSSSSDSGFLTTRSISRAIGRAPNARSKPFAASHARAAGSSSIVTPLAATIAAQLVDLLVDDRSISAVPERVEGDGGVEPVAELRRERPLERAARRAALAAARANPMRRSDRSRAPALVVMIRMTWRKSALRPCESVSVA